MSGRTWKNAATLAFAIGFRLLPSVSPVLETFQIEKQVSVLPYPGVRRDDHSYFVTGSNTFQDSLDFHMEGPRNIHVYPIGTCGKLGV